MKMAGVFGQVRQNYQALLMLIQHFEGIKNIIEAWQEVSVNCLNGVWRRLLPKFMHSFTDVSH